MKTVDTLDLPPTSSIDCDVAVVGGGVAGLAVALSLARRRVKVCVFEAGGPMLPVGQDLYEGTVTGCLFPEGSRYLSESRVRRLGGSTSMWGGWCRPLETIDFQKRGWIDHSGWPIQPRDLRRHYRSACDFLGLSGHGLAAFSPAVPRHAEPRADLHDVTWLRSLIRNHGEYWARELNRYGVTIYTHTSLHDLVPTEDGGALSSITVKTLAGQHIPVHAHAYVLAAGGIENARLLLLGRRRHGARATYCNENVGRFFMEHPHLVVGQVVGAREELRPYSRWIQSLDGTYRHNAFRLRDRVQGMERLSNGAFAIVPIASGASSLESFESFRRGCAAHFFPMGRVQRMSDAAEAAIQRCFERASTDLKRHRFSADEAVIHGAVLLRGEQRPLPTNQVRLSDSAVDANRDPRVELRLTLPPAEIQDFARASTLFARAFEDGGRGRAQVYSADELLLGGGGCHHMGSTRMSHDPRDGVVDEQLRVHGVKNLYVAGSSVFPTSGWSNPTLTLVALSFRLGEALLADLGKWQRNIAAVRGGKATSTPDSLSC